MTIEDWSIHQGDLHEFPTQLKGMSDQGMVDAVSTNTEDNGEHVVERAAASMRLKNVN